MLNRVRTDAALSNQTAVWPFDSGLRVPDRPLVLAEVYPSLMKNAVAVHGDGDEILDRAQVRVNAESFASLDAEEGLQDVFAGAVFLAADQRRVVETRRSCVSRGRWAFGCARRSRNTRHRRRRQGPRRTGRAATIRSWRRAR